MVALKNGMFVAAAVLLLATAVVQAGDDPHLEGARAIFEWIAASEGGIVSSKQEVRRAVPGDKTTPLIVAATERIEAGEIMVRVPWDNIIKPDNPDDDGQLPCSTATSLAREMKLGKDSKYAPYVEYLNGESAQGIPSVWSPAARELFEQVIGNKDIPPARATTWITKNWYGRCRGDPKDEISTKAALMVIQRSDDEIMIPAYDAYNHRNGNWTSTDTVIKIGEYHETTATRTIEAGEEIYLSYNLCRHCGGRKHDYGTGEILRDYGFVEDYPRRFYYMDEIEFDIDQDENGKLKVTWDQQWQPKTMKSKERTKAFFRHQIRRLLRLKLVDWNFNYEDKEDIGMTRYEWDSIWKFVDANVEAMKVAMDTLTDGEESTATCSIGSDGEETCAAVDALTSATFYDNLEYEWDDLPYAQDTCAFGSWMKKYKKTYPVIEKVQTMYQDLQFKEHPGADDICMELDRIVQICSNYRPHYHEYMTHAAARYVKDVRRIIFIGGGDSMLLHEALKYPNIEKVVGLELDQTVTRKSFKHFRSQPHFDNDKVEWWFGDATKSLLLLPDDYFGSFDLVLVDLSETVMSMSVTKELDVFDALSLLLSPEGVIVKNEMYKDKFNEVFDYTMELYYICPVICDQVLVFGSNNVDFFHAPTYDHGIDTHLYKNMHTPDTRHDLMHHYKKNIAPAEKCNITSSEDLSVQGTAAGIIEIFDAENVETTLDESILKLIKSAAKAVGFTVTSEPVFENNFGVLVMEEGYISAKLWPDEKYVAFDINLWGRTYKIEDIKAALAKAVGSNDTSTYRVVVGGMYGSSTWKEDQQIVGPKVKQLRNCKDDIVKKGKLDDKMALTVTAEEVVPLTHAKDITAAVVCGPAKEKCVSLEALKGHADVKDVITIYECPEGDGIEAMVACEAAVLASLTEKLGQSPNPKIKLLVLDQSASFKMHQIFNNILVVEPAADEIFDGSCITMTWSPDLTGQTWRREFLDRLRKVFKWDPAVRVELVLQAGGKSFEAGIFSPTIENPSYDFDKMESRISERLSKSKAKIEIRHIHGALYRFIDPYHPKEFKQADYDLVPGNSQYAAQAPLGRQVILQLVKNSEKKTALELTLEKVSSFLTEAFDQVHIQPTITEKYTIGDGGVILASSPDSNFVVVWDGKEHIDVNVFSYRQSVEFADKFKTAFLNASANTLMVGLRDDQPRGTGHVVNFMSDIV